MISILYVDDEATLLDITKLYLEKTGGFFVDTCTSARDALEKLSTTAYDAVVSDYQMPDMDGLEFLQTLRKTDPDLPFILFTGRGREEVAIEALNSGADFYLQKGGEPRSQFAELEGKIQQTVKRRRTELALQVSEERFRGIFDNAPVGIFHTTLDGQIIDVNPVFAHMFGYGSPEEMIEDVNGTDLIEAHYTDPEQRRMIVKEVLASETWHTYDVPFLRRDGSTFKTLMSIRSYVPESGTTRELEGFIVDLTETLVAEAKIRQGERRYHNLFDAVGDALLVLDHGTGAILDANPASVGLFGYTGDELKSMQYQDLVAEPDQADTSGTGTPAVLPQIAYRKKDGTVFVAEITASQYPQKTRTINIVSIRDITERKRVEERLIAAQRLYAVLSEINQTIVRVHDLETLLSDICRIAVEFGNFRMVWIGFVNQDSQAVRPVAHWGNEAGYLSVIEISPSGGNLGMSPAGRAIQLGEHDICNDIATDPRMEPWRTEALARGYRSSAAFPIRLHGAVIGAISIYAGEPDYFNENEIRLIDEIAMDVSFSLDMLDEQARRMRAEKDLAGSEERAQYLAEVLDSSSQPFGILYPDGSIGIVNPALCDLLGYQESELRQMDWKDILSPEYIAHGREIIRTLETTGIPQREEMACRRKDGTTVPVEIFLHRVIDPDRNVRHFSAFITDISGRREAEDRILAERDLARQYLDTAFVLLAVIDREGIITLINRRGCEILGYTEAELLGKNWVDLLVPADARSEVRDALSGMMEGECGTLVYHENTVVTKSGEVRLLAFQNSVLAGPGSEPRGILFSAWDITDQRDVEASLQQSEERFRTLIQNVSEMIQILSCSGEIIYSSPSTRTIAGYDPDETVGTSFLAYIPADDRDGIRQAFEGVCSGTNAGISLECRILHADGHTIDVETVSLNLLDAPGINGIVAMTRPITARKHAEATRRECEEQLSAILASSSDAILICGDTIREHNPQAERLFEYAKSEFAGLTIDDLLMPRAGEGDEPDTPGSAVFTETLATGASPLSVHGRKKDGTLFPAEVTVRSVTACDGQRRVVLIREVPVLPPCQFSCEDHPDPVIECGAKKEIRNVNAAAHAALRSWGMPDTPAAFMPPDIDAILAGFAGGKTVDESREVRVGPGWYCETIRPTPDDGGCRIYARDITDHVMAINALEQANRKVNLFSSLNRHDIRNRLAGLVSYLSLSEGLAEDKKLQDYLHQADLNAERIREQVERPLGVNDLGAHAPVWQRVSDIIAAESRLLDHGDIAVEDETCGLRVYADPMLAQVIGELMANSLQHGGHVTRMGFFVRESRDHCTLVYEDDGAGIPEGEKEQVFSRGGTTDERVRASFGLPLIRDILLFTGITLSETGEPGIGARFELVIPRGKFRLDTPE